MRSRGTKLLKWVASTPRHAFGRKPDIVHDAGTPDSEQCTQPSSGVVSPSSSQDLHMQSSIESVSSADASTDSSDDEEPATSNNPYAPFLYPLPAAEAEHLTVPVSPATAIPSGSATPGVGGVVPTRRQSHQSRSSISMTPRLSIAVPQDNQASYFSLTPRGSSSRVGTPGSANVPLTPSEISISRRASMMGQPMAWVSTPRTGNSSGANTPGARNGSIFYSPWTPRASVSPMPQSPGLAASPKATTGRSRAGSVASELRPEGHRALEPHEPLWHRRLCTRLAAVPSLSVPEYHDEKDAQFIADIESQDAAQTAERSALLQQVSESLHALGVAPTQVPTEPTFAPSALLQADFEFPECGLTESPFDKEGQEALPQYACSVHLEGFLPRKMEYDAPGKPSPNRAWQSVYFVLHGTMLSLYSVDLGSYYTKEHALADEWHLKDSRMVHTVPYSLGETDPGSDDDSREKNGLAHRIGHGVLHMVQLDRDPVSLADAIKSSHMRTYSLLGAECGYASDYTKRPHVVRFRIQGEQFIVQTRDNFHVVDLIEAFQASTNICPDLDTRTRTLKLTVPKFLTLPRRRRRRRGAETVTLRTSPQASHTVST